MDEQVNPATMRLRRTLRDAFRAGAGAEIES